ncbi:hypothetical protein [Labrenzia sp. R5_0]|uniref:hypothetical protein n=1 Tax=Labrenzia sp. R5_0 TaxID=2821108 RepID=UPI001ADC2B82|nr:hypothetical protein [Labrenzia sp. R5_0]MBO9458953.1 hypothetical protein [Labrenzia sp. R5_0]
MELERALEVVACINACVTYPMGLVSRDKIQPLGKISLAEMLQAVEVVKAKNKSVEEEERKPGAGYTTYTVPAERLVAAAFVLNNYEPQHEVIVAKPDYLFSDNNIVLAVIRQPVMEDEDDG